ncbi:B3 domain-containing protein Os01g0234100-like [Andrographis paniculata]|uniref:B3 domain-containing protein Os01g0234100-like n=1 Tax=Andrographis paniculata TaxID=175694 RepID=UPI0021E8D37F|nr:B3 domain-containing protein Os01g0234100-like [Andrographis paniculata]XP_051117587.1 B3 domain-containing protein Os01g0234100-like [Andrographis paniculata]
MKLKIVHQNPENRGGEELEMKKEILEMDRNQMEEDEQQKQQQPPVSVSPEDHEFVKENSTPLDPSPISAFDPTLVSGKRQRKPKEIVDEISPIFRKKKKSSVSKHKHGIYASGRTSTSFGDGAFGNSGNPVPLKSPIVIRAEEVQANLGDEHPSFLKPLVRSHVASCFWMGLPVPFCKLYLPTRDSTVTLENENGEEFSIKYIAHKTGLSAGWRKFVAGNKLLEGDVLVFQLVGPCKFKILIVRANDLTEVDGALSLLILDSQTKPDAGRATDARVRKNRHPKSLPLTVLQKKKHNQDRLFPEEQSGNDSDEVASEVLEGSKISRNSFSFKDVRSFDEFQIIVNGSCIDAEIPEPIRRKYYNLCCSKNSILHDRILPGLYRKLAAGMIVEAVTIADAIRGCKINTSKKEFDAWEKSLKSFELLGLNVGFLRARLRRLATMAFESEGASETKRFRDAQMGFDRTEIEIRRLETKLVELKELWVKCYEEEEELRTNADCCEFSFREEAKAPW